jgi:hypothetical protein
MYQLQSTKRAPPRRATTSSPFAKGKEPSSFPEYDFLALITCITHLYKKEGSVGMQPRNLLASAASNQESAPQTHQGIHERLTFTANLPSSQSLIQLSMGMRSPKSCSSSHRGNCFIAVVKCETQKQPVLFYQSSGF